MTLSKLDECGRMRQITFAKFQTASIVIKAITRGLPERI